MIDNNSIIANEYTDIKIKKKRVVGAHNCKLQHNSNSNYNQTYIMLNIFKEKNPQWCYIY